MSNAVEHDRRALPSYPSFFDEACAPLDAAIWYARHGWPVFPCQPGSISCKRPLTPHGFRDASTDETAIRRWWKRYPDALIGVAMGAASGVFAIDLDAPSEARVDDGTTAWRRLAERHGCPPTHAHLTPGGGMHYLFKYRADRPTRNRRGMLPPGMDVRGDGGYLIVPPSQLRDGRTYKIITPANFLHFAEAPDWLYKLLEDPGGASAAESSATNGRAFHDGQECAWGLAILRRCADDVACAPEGNRNNILNAVAYRLGRLVGGGFLDRSEVEEELRNAARSNGYVASDGLRAAEATIRSGIDAGILKPHPGPSDGSGTEPAADPHADTAAPTLLLWHGESPPSPPAMLIEGLLPVSGLVIVAGQSGMAKTFGALDLSFSVMTGIDFARHKALRRGGVMWLAAEGESEVFSRLEGPICDKAAALAEMKIDAAKLPFARQALQVPQLTATSAKKGLLELAGAARAGLEETFGVELVLIVVDTLNASAGFQDENSSAEVQRAMNLLRDLSRQIGALVVMIDHYGKSTETGVRGSSAKEAAADAVLAFLGTRDPDGNISERRMTLTKLRAGPAGITIRFDLRVVQPPGFVGPTCVIDWKETLDGAASKGKSDRSAWTGQTRILKRAFEATLASYGKPLWPYGSEGPQVMAVERKLVRDEFFAAFSTDEEARDATKKRAFNRAVQLVTAKGLLGAREINGAAWLWLAQG
jgi:Bifunctional DNA primase/polymerase, N-terminal/AAA domain